MRILFANTLHFKHGGPSIHTFELAEMLRQRGHEVEIFSMQHERNLQSDIAEYFPSKIDYPELLKEGGVKNIFRVLGRTFYSKESRRNIERLINDSRPDILHLQNYLHHLTPSIIFPARKRGIPVFWTLHDSVLVCPNTNLFDDHLSRPCTLCDNSLKRLLLPSLKKCKKDSRGASAVASLEALSFKIMGLENLIDRFISPSKFLINQLQSMGFRGKNIDYLPNFVDFPEIKVPDGGDYLLYFGRIEYEKGIFDLVDAMRLVDKDISLYIAGAGKAEIQLQRRVEDIENIHFIGHLQKERLIETISGSRFTVVPSICYENAPLTLVESMFMSRPVIGSNIGGIPELIDHGETGYIFEPGDKDALAGYITKLWNDPSLVRKMGKLANERTRKRHSSGRYLDELEKSYKSVRELM